ncbi:unnamed protein product [Malus baccata var. baccata]
MAPYQALKIHASNAVVWDYRTGRLVAPPRPPPPPPRDLVRYVMPNGEEAIASLVNGNINGHDHLLRQETIDTCYALRRRARKTKGRRRISVYYDRFSAGHEWLLDGWVAENRTTPSGQHWLYYDPLGKQYKSKKEVLKFWQDQRRYER